MIFSNAAATVREGPRNASASYVISLMGDAPVFGPFRGDMVLLDTAGQARNSDWAALAECLSQRVKAARSVVILASGELAAAAAVELGARLAATVWLLQPGPPPESLLRGAFHVLYDPGVDTAAAEAAAWVRGGAIAVRAPGAGPWLRNVLELRGVTAALVAAPARPDVIMRRFRLALRAQRRQSPYALWMLAKRLQRHPQRRVAAVTLLQAAADLPSTMKGPIQFDLAELRMVLGSPKAALEAYRGALREKPDAAWYWLQASKAGLASAGGQTGTDEAIFATAAAQRAERLKPDLPRLGEHLANLTVAGLWPAPEGGSEVQTARLLALEPVAAAGEFGSNVRAWWEALARQDFVAVRSALRLQDWARPEDAAEIAALLGEVRRGIARPEDLTLDALLNRMCDGMLLRLKGGSLEVSSRNSLKVLVEELLVFDEYHFQSDRPAPFVVDCGVNFGLSLYCTKARYPGARIVGFEPHPDMYALARANIERNGWEADIDLHRAAIGPEDGTARFLISSEDDMAASLMPRLRDAGRPVKEIEVETVRLSRILDRPVDFLKMDIEGSEVEVLRECEAALGQVEALFCEYHHTPGLEEDRLGSVMGVLWRAGFNSHVSRSPWVRRKYGYRPDLAARDSHSLSIFGRKRDKMLGPIGGHETVGRASKA